MTFGEFKFTQVVVQFHDLRRLEESSLSRCRLVLDYALHLTAMRVEHGYHQTSVADCHLCVLWSPSLTFGLA